MILLIAAIIFFGGIIIGIPLFFSVGLTNLAYYRLAGGFPYEIIVQQIARIWPDSSVLARISSALEGDAYTYNVLYVVLIFLFAYFWVTVQFQPREMAKNLRDSGSFIPGLRPGRRTADYLETVMTRITYFGAAFLAGIAIIPTVLSYGLGIDWRVTTFLGGTGLLIVVSVSLDLVQKIEANLLMRSYDGFSASGRIKGAYS
jgi:preprotein translocase subunit SecY